MTGASVWIYFRGATFTYPEVSYRRSLSKSTNIPYATYTCPGVSYRRSLSKSTDSFCH